MRLRTPRSTRTDTPFPNTTLFRSKAGLRPHITLGYDACAAAARARACRSPALRPGDADRRPGGESGRSEEHTSELQSLMRISYAVFCLQKKTLLPYNIDVTSSLLHTEHAHNVNKYKQKN